jgi:hypothetical protein
MNMQTAKMDERSKEAVTIREKALAEVEQLKAEKAELLAQLEASKAARTDSQRTEMSPVRREEQTALSDSPPLNMEVYGKISGQHLLIVVDQDGDVERHQNRGYHFCEFGEIGTNSRKGVDAGEDNRISWHSGTDEGGKPYRSYLMKIDEQYWKEQEAKKQSFAERNNAELKRRALADGDGRYTPTQGINLRN